MAFQPAPEILDAYARVLVDFALGTGKGIARGDVVMISASEEAKPLYVAVRNAVLRSGGTVIRDYSPSGVARSALEIASIEQLSTFHRAYYRGLAETIDHRIAILSTNDPYELDGIEPKKLLAGRSTSHPWREWLARKEAQGRYTWTLGLYGTAAMAKEARMPLAAYWDEITKACFLDEPNPIKRWRETFREIARVKRRLDALAIERLHIEGEGVDLSVAVGEQRRWLGGTGRNIPSFEIFTSPDWRGTEGTISFTEPVYRDGGMMKGVRLRLRARTDRRGDCERERGAAPRDDRRAIRARAASARCRSRTAASARSRASWPRRSTTRTAAGRRGTSTSRSATPTARPTPATSPSSAAATHPARLQHLRRPHGHRHHRPPYRDRHAPRREEEDDLRRGPLHGLRLHL